jgi:hypothetical protein
MQIDLVQNKGLPLLFKHVDCFGYNQSKLKNSKKPQNAKNIAKYMPEFAVFFSLF